MARQDDEDGEGLFWARLLVVLAVALVVLLALVASSLWNTCLSGEMTLDDLAMSRRDICRAAWTPRRWTTTLAAYGLVAAAPLSVVGALVWWRRRRRRSADRPGARRDATTAS